MLKMANILEEVTSLENSLEKVASSKTDTNSLASFLDKVAESAEEFPEDEEDKKKEKEDKDKDDKEKDDKDKKEGSMTESPELVDKIANAVIAKLEKIAVLDTNETQGSEVSNTAGGANDGAATNAGRATDQVISGDKVQSESESNPNAHTPKDVKGKGDLIANQAPNSNGMAEPLQKAGSVSYTAKEAAILEKFASIGYEHVVDVYSDKIVQEKVASAIAAEKAKEAPTKIAQAILANERNSTAKTANKSEATNAQEKLAQIQKNDPTLFSALKVLAERKLI